MPDEYGRPRVFNRRTARAADTKDAVYVGRPSRWGNPFPINDLNTRAMAIGAFRAYARHKLKSDPRWLDPLRGKDLVCWCAPEPCHADILLLLANPAPPGQGDVW